ncbi:MAG TPA: cupin domain-containing protein [Tepidisphaeraceae bacterium]|jgi:quercetin dioxygenase-like cupin family protein|nr:cupin domain-containing protein [Tepidisphaeraceae bacterium]
MTPTIRCNPSSSAEHLSFEWGKLTWFASAALGNSSDMTVGRCILNPGKSNPRHQHPNCSETLVVLQGRIAHTGPDGSEVEMNVGDTVTIPAGIWHHARNIGDEEAVLYIAFSSADRKTIGET